MTKNESAWYVYVALCSDHSLYTGVTTDLARREREHNEGNNGARYTRSRRPIKIVYSERVEDRSSALRREYAVKQLSSIEKQRLVSGDAETTKLSHGEG